MPTMPRYPPQGIPRCPICNAPYQTCTGHAPGWDSSPQYLVGARLPRRAPVPVPGARTQAFLYPPHVKGVISMPEKNEATTPAPRTGGVHRQYPRPAPEAAPAPAPAPKTAKTPKPAPKEDAA